MRTSHAGVQRRVESMLEAAKRPATAQTQAPIATQAGKNGSAALQQQQLPGAESAAEQMQPTQGLQPAWAEASVEPEAEHDGLGSLEPFLDLQGMTGGSIC